MTTFYILFELMKTNKELLDSEELSKCLSCFYIAVFCFDGCSVTSASLDARRDAEHVLVFILLPISSQSKEPVGKIKRMKRKGAKEDIQEDKIQKIKAHEGNCLEEK